jgi:hypothetical protein
MKIGISGKMVLMLLAVSLLLVGAMAAAMNWSFQKGFLDYSATSFTNEGGFYWASTTHATYSSSGVSATYVSFGRLLGYYNSAIVDVHGAGAQRSNHKSDIAVQADGVADVGHGSFYYHGPQGDLLRLDNMVRCVRDL